MTIHIRWVSYANSWPLKNNWKHMNVETNGNYRCFYFCLFRLYVIIPKLSPPSISSGIRVVRSLVFCVVFCRLLFVLLSFLFMRFLSFDLRIRITPLVSSNSLYHRHFYWSACTNPINWAVAYLCVRGIDFSSFCDVSIGYRNCSYSVPFFCFSFYH